MMTFHKFKVVTSEAVTRFRPATVVLGGILVHLTLGTLYTFGNINPYLTSYLRHQGIPRDLTYTQSSWIYALSCAGQGSAMFLGGVVERKLGPRMATLTGCWLMSLGVFLTHWSVQSSFAVTLLTYGLLPGLGIGLAYAVPISCAMKWLPDKKGVASGAIVAGFGGGAFLFNMVQTRWINPHNATPTLRDGLETYFQDARLLSQVPSVFLLLAVCYVGMQLTGCLLLANPLTQPATTATATATTTVSLAITNSTTSLITTTSVPYVREVNGVNHVSQNNVSQKSKNLKTPCVPETGQDKDGEMSPRQVLQSRHFYWLFFIFFFSTQSVVFVVTLYKAYGQTFIPDDEFLSLVGTLAAVCNGLGRLAWGVMADWYSFKRATILMSSLTAVLMLTFQLTPLGGKGHFLVHVCLLFGAFSGSYAMLPVATAKCFGRKYIATNYGLVYASQVLVCPLAVFTSDLLMTTIGWTGLFYLVAASSLIALVLALTLTAKDLHGKEI